MPKGIYGRKENKPIWFIGETKRCGKCLTYKKFADFSKDIRRSGGLNNECRVCNRNKVRNWNRNRQRPSNYQSRRQYHIDYQKRYKKENPEKVEARRLVNEAIRKGSLKKEPCVVCGKEKSVGHHPDYSKPLYVVWYCQGHHQQEHFRLRNN